MSAPTSPAAGGERPGAGRDIVLGVSGASGIPYAQDLLRRLLENTAYRVHLVFTPNAHYVMAREASYPVKGGAVDPAEFASDGAPELRARLDKLLNASPDGGSARVVQYPPRDIGARLASGSFLHDGMIICPASVRTCGAIATGMTDNLLTRAADVTLKERRRLVLVPRETPLHLLHLRTLTSLAEAGATILPAMPGFYHRPTSIEDITRFLSMKVFDVLGIPFESPDRWNPGEADAD